jgi:hypothetical protein
MEDRELLKVFDECIEELVQEIKDIEEGCRDDCLEFLISYPIKPEYLSKLNLYCRFPPPPQFKIVTIVKQRPEPAAAAPVTVVSERRTSRVVRKRKLDGDDEVSPPLLPRIKLSQDKPEDENGKEGEGKDHPPPKPPGRRPGRPRLSDRIQPPPAT